MRWTPLFGHKVGRKVDRKGRIGMCRSIKTLRRPEGPPSDDELDAAALQFVRKLSGYRVPSQTNRVVFDRAVAEISAASRRLFDDLIVARRPVTDPEPSR